MSETAARAAELSIDRLFDAPALAGPTIMGLQITPDGTRITYLRGGEEHKDRLDLWEYRVAEARAQRLVAADLFESASRPPSDEELGKRERQRLAAFSGILEYSFAASGKALLFPSGGRLFYVDLDAAPARALREIGPGRGFATDASISPRGRYVSYVRDQNLLVFALATDAEIAITEDGDGPIKYGLAEFVAQEEMGRSDGYWWSPDDRYLAFARVDETPVPVTQRFEIAADNVATFAQHYPSAGAANARVTLGVAEPASGAVLWLDLGTDDHYVARVDWLPDGRTLAVQRQSRDQRRLDLLFVDVASGTATTILSETSSTWVELHDELTFLKKSPEFIWASMRDGRQHLYLYAGDGRLIRQLTAGDWCVDDFRGRAIKWVDEAQRLVYFTATRDGPTSRKLYRVALDDAADAEPQRITPEDGVHAITIAPGGQFYLDQFTSRAQPPRIALHRIDGSFIAYLLENRLDEHHPDAPYAHTNSVPEFGVLTAADGLALHFRLFKPADFDPRQRHAAILDVYGGPGVQRVLDAWTGSSFTQILTRAGYVVLQVDNRGSAFRGVEFQAPIRGQLGHIEVEDQVLAARWLAAQSYVDAARIGVWGWSYGGYLSLMLMCKAPEIFRAGVAGAPVTDWTLYDTHYTERYLGTPVENAAGYAASAVFPYVADLRGALLVIHGMADDNVLFLHSTKLFRRLQDLGKLFEVMVYPGGKHGLTRQHDGRHAYATILRFFDQHLQGGSTATADS
jgi:dipeptidyl-peptidase-4